MNIEAWCQSCRVDHFGYGYYSDVGPRGRLPYDRKPRWWWVPRRERKSVLAKLRADEHVGASEEAYEAAKVFLDGGDSAAVQQALKTRDIGTPKYPSDNRGLELGPCKTCGHSPRLRWSTLFKAMEKAVQDGETRIYY